MYYYMQGFEFSRSLTSIEFLPSFSDNKIEGGTRLKIYFKEGAKSKDFESLLVPGVRIISNEVLHSNKRTELKPILLKFNSHLLKVYDLDSRYITYLVAKDRDTHFRETSKSTIWVINESTANNCDSLLTELNKSLFIEWTSIPCNEKYSYRAVNTHAGISDSSGGEVPSVTSSSNLSISFDSYSKWRLDQARVLVGFYDLLKSILPNYVIQFEGLRITDTEKLPERRIDVNISGFGNLDMHPSMYNKDLYPKKSDVRISIKMPDQLEYMNLKNRYQNYKFLSDKVTYTVKDTKGLDWMCHIWWEPFRDSASIQQARDEASTISYTLDINCSLNYFEVEDELYEIVNSLNVNVYGRSNRGDLLVSNKIITN